MNFKGVVFDMDGVITDTAKVHSMAWKEMFDSFLKKWSERHSQPFIPFDAESDYLLYVDGKPRHEGVISFMESRSINLPLGNYKDTPDKETIHGLGNSKNKLFQKIIKTEGPTVFETSVQMVKELKRRGIKVGVATSSKNGKLVLNKARLQNLFESFVDGVVSLELKLKGKPEPDIFVKAAKDLGLRPHDCIMVEDAISGVTAGMRGGFGLVLGVARSLPGNMLKMHGADIVVNDLADITIEELDSWFDKGLKRDGWTLEYHDFNLEEERLRETLCTVGNGYFGTRGCFEGKSASHTHYPGTYIAGLYNKLPSKVHGHTVYNNDFVNCPNWLLIEFKIGNGPYIDLLEEDILSYHHSLDMQTGTMERRITFKDKVGRITQIHSKRIASMADPHYGAIQYNIIPLNYSGKITIRSSLDGNVINYGVARYRDLNSKHLSYVSSNKTKKGIYLHTRTNESKIDIIMDAKTVVYENNVKAAKDKKITKNKACISEEIEIDVQDSNTYTIEKLVTIFTSHDEKVKDPKAASMRAIEKVNSFKDIYITHEKAWGKFWEMADMRIDGDRFAQKGLRLHTYHLLVSASPHNRDFDAGITARGLHGEAYRGHVFWDELYIFSFYNLNFPEITRSLLMYRYRRLDAAREYARDNGYEGAMYPWQTANDGSEETQTLHYNPISGKWDLDLSCRQRHVSIAIFYNVWTYVEHTGDREFLEKYGAEMMIEIARFWASITKLDPQTNRYHISGVMGPDEYHEKLPGSDEPGLKDNAYTNIMVVWLLEKTLTLIEEELPQNVLKKLARKIKFSMSETQKWHDITTRMNVVITHDGIISQFDGYMDLKELDFEVYRQQYGNIHRMDRILKSEGDSPDNHKISKQADVLMLFYLLTADKVKDILNHLGYSIQSGTKLLRDNYEYYHSRTSHGSTLSMVVHAAVSMDIAEFKVIWQWFMNALKSDIYDTQQGTTAEGIHTGVMAGTLDIVYIDFAGISFFKDKLHIKPNLPKHWNKFSFNIWYRKNLYDLEISREKLKICVNSLKKKSHDTKYYISINDKDYTLTEGKARTISIQ